MLQLFCIAANVGYGGCCAKRTQKTREKGRVLKLTFQFLLVFFAAFGTSTMAQTTEGQAWVEAMNACEVLISDQSFDGFEGFDVAKSKLNVEPQLERAFQHPNTELISSAISDGSEWFLCVVTDKMPVLGEERGAIIGTVTGTLLAQINKNQNRTMVFDDGKTLAPVRVICRDGEQLTSVFAFLTDDSEFRIAVTNSLPNGIESPCSN